MEREKALGDYLKGPDAKWLGNDREAKATAPMGDADDEEEARRRAAMDALDSCGAFDALNGASAHLQSQVRAHTLEARLRDAARDPQDAIVTALQELVERNNRWLAEEAAQHLDALQPAGRGGTVPPGAGEVLVGPVAWPADGGPGCGTITREGREWPYRDYKDQLHLTDHKGPELATRLGLEPGVTEERQCVLLHAVAAASWAKTGVPPSATEVQTLALEARWETWQHAAEAQGALGATPSLVSRREADLRIFGHDALMAHHDKDFRSLEAYPSTT